MYILYRQILSSAIKMQKMYNKINKFFHISAGLLAECSDLPILQSQKVNPIVDCQDLWFHIKFMNEEVIVQMLYQLLILTLVTLKL